jgi:hypothetical protein
MAEMICRYSGDRDHAIVSYLYGDDDGFGPVERAAFQSHLTTCERCRAELTAFQGVRESLGCWSPPRLRSQDHPSFGAAGLANRDDGPVSGRSWWREMPAWAQAAAAMLCIGVGAGFANLDVKYDGNGLQVRTGWLSTSTPASPAAPSGVQDVSLATRLEAPWRPELTALEERLRGELQAVDAKASGGNNADVLRRARALVDESERRQQSELALRLGEAMREINAQRQADLVRIDRNIGTMQSTTGRELLRQRNDMLNYVTLRTSGQRPQ